MTELPTDLKTLIRDAVVTEVKAILDELFERVEKPAPARKRVQKATTPLPSAVEVRAGTKPPRQGSKLRLLFNVIAENGAFPVEGDETTVWLRSQGLSRTHLQQLWNGGYLIPVKPHPAAQALGADAEHPSASAAEGEQP